MSSTIIMRYAFKSRSRFSGVLGCPELSEDKTILDLKREVDTIKKTQSEAMVEIENLGK